jgi:hypothetical protein
MPFIQVNVKQQIEERKQSNPEFKKLWDEMKSEREENKRTLEPSEFQKFLEEQLNDPEFKKEWDLLEPERIKVRKEIESQKIK